MPAGILITTREGLEAFFWAILPAKYWRYIEGKKRNLAMIRCL